MERLDMNDLERKVQAVNECNEAAVALYDSLALFFRPYVGASLFKQDGTLLARIENKMPRLPRGGTTKAFHHRMTFYLAFEVVTDVAGTQYRQVVYIGRVADGELTELCERPTHRRDYTEKEVREKREAVAKAKEAYDKAKYDLAPFGEY